MPRPDSKRLRKLLDELRALKESEKLTEPEFKRILREASAASGGYGDVLGDFLYLVDPEWARRAIEKAPAANPK